MLTFTNFIFLFCLTGNSDYFSNAFAITDNKGRSPRIMETHKHKNYEDEPYNDFINPEMDLPESFDAREEWPECESIGKVPNQGFCSSDWAVIAAATMTDRLCIRNNGVIRFEVSVEEFITCCVKCFNSDVNGCLAGGRPYEAWKYWEKNGVVSGGAYHSKEGCKPYSDEAYEQAAPLECTDFCTNNKYNVSYEDDKQYGKKAKTILSGNIEDIQKEIMTSGPVQSQMRVHTDFTDYQEGIYQHTGGYFSKAYHSVKLIGWGQESNNRSYWLAVNCWGEKWGNMFGLFKIRMGTDECGIESIIYADGDVDGSEWRKAKIRRVTEKIFIVRSSQCGATFGTNCLIIGFFTLVFLFI